MKIVLGIVAAVFVFGLGIGVGARLASGGGASTPPGPLAHGGASDDAGSGAPRCRPQSERAYPRDHAPTQTSPGHRLPSAARDDRRGASQRGAIPYQDARLHAAGAPGPQPVAPAIRQPAL